MIGAGKLDRKIIIERNAPGADDAFGEPTTSWSTFYTCQAQRTDVKDAEKVQTDQVQGSIMSRFVIRSMVKSRTINSADRLNYESKTWQIHGSKEVSGEGRKKYIEITASTGND